MENGIEETSISIMNTTNTIILFNILHYNMVV